MRDKERRGTHITRSVCSLCSCDLRSAQLEGTSARQSFPDKLIGANCTRQTHKSFMDTNGSMGGQAEFNFSGPLASHTFIVGPGKCCWLGDCGHIAGAPTSGRVSMKPMECRFDKGIHFWHWIQIERENNVEDSKKLSKIGLVLVCFRLKKVLEIQIGRTGQVKRDLREGKKNGEVSKPVGGGFSRFSEESLTVSWTALGISM